MYGGNTKGEGYCACVICARDDHKLAVMLFREFLEWFPVDAKGASIWVSPSGQKCLTCEELLWTPDGAHELLVRARYKGYHIELTFAARVYVSVSWHHILSGELCQVRHDHPDMPMVVAAALAQAWRQWKAECDQMRGLADHTLRAMKHDGI